MDLNSRPDFATIRGNTTDSHFLRFIAMKVVIQEIPSGLYLSEGNFWTLAIESATTFDSRSTALEKISNLDLQNVQLVINREIKEWEIFPIAASSP